MSESWEIPTKREKPMITHILKDGTVLEDITGHVVKKEDTPLAYGVLEQKKEKEREKDD